LSMAAAATLSLNCSDLPEAKYWARKARLHGRSKVVGLPVLSEIDNGDVDEFDMVAKEESHSWCCQVCTFRNHELISCCEVCNSEKGAQGSPNVGAKVPSIQPIPNQDWPALPEAWIDCDVSSVASSWMDVGAAQEHGDSDDDADMGFAVVEVTSTKAHSKPMLWSAVVGRSATAAVAPAAKVAVPPPLSRKPAVRTHNKKTEDEDPDEVLDELEARRMHGNSKQRHCRMRKR